MRTPFSMIIKIVIVVLFISCDATDCQKLPKSFDSYAQAQSLIINSNFKLTEHLNTKSSSWIREISYFSCDGASGFLILTTDSNKYIHEKVPIEIWIDFKNADSFGQYWNKNLKNKYRLNIK